MISHRRLLTYVVRALCLFVGVMLAALCALAIRLAGPQLEAEFFPIIKASHVAHSVKFEPGRQLCWSVNFIKFRNDAPAYFNYRVVFQPDPDPEHPENKTGRSRVPLAVYRLRPDGSKIYLSTSGFANHSADKGPWISNYCAELPQGLTLNTPFTVEGEGFYTTWHNLWLVPQELPEFTVPNPEDMAGADSIKPSPDSSPERTAAEP